jgi:hypothetical protein
MIGLLIFLVASEKICWLNKTKINIKIQNLIEENKIQGKIGVKNEEKETRK